MSLYIMSNVSNTLVDLENWKIRNYLSENVELIKKTNKKTKQNKTKQNKTKTVKMMGRTF